MVAILEKGKLRDFDWLLTLLALAIALFGTWMIYNAQPDAGYWKKQFIGLGVSTVVMLAVAFTDYRKLVHFAPAFYAFGLFLLVIVLVPGIGLKINGQRCWIGVPGIGQFQPSEFMKIPTVLMLARYYGRTRGSTLTLRQTLMGVAILALPVGLILLEPDSGQALTYFPLLAVVLDPENADRRGFGYHTWQSILTVGKGGLWGSATRGDASQSKLKFLPEPHTDFIFAVTAENTGFVGCVLLLLAYAVLLTKLIHGARRAPDRTGMLVIMAIVGGLAFQIFINVGMALGMLPVIGVPLPLMSAGLSAILATSVAIGFAISIRLRRFVN